MKMLQSLLKNMKIQRKPLQFLTCHKYLRNPFSIPLKPLFYPSIFSSRCLSHPIFPQKFSNFGNICSFTTLGWSNDTKEGKPAPVLALLELYKFADETDRDSEEVEWEDQDDEDPEVGDGGAGGGIVLQNVPWGEKVLSIAREVLLPFGDDIKLYAFKTTPSGYIYVRLDNLTTKFGCPDMEEIEKYSTEFRRRLEEEGSKGQIPDNLALEVSSPGGNRLLMVPDDLHRFKDFPMVVSYIEETDSPAKSHEKTGVFFLVSIEKDIMHCVWKLADVRENRDPASKGKPLTRKQRDWRLKLPYNVLKKVSLCIEC